MFPDQDADLFMIPTAEVPLTAMHGDEILERDDLPRQYAAYTPCFRKEAGAAGKDTRGLDSPASIRKSRTRVADRSPSVRSTRSKR